LSWEEESGKPDQAELDVTMKTEPYKTERAVRLKAAVRFRIPERLNAAEVQKADNGRKPE